MVKEKHQSWRAKNDILDTDGIEELRDVTKRGRAESEVVL